jgi:hypothetical protein
MTVVQDECRNHVSMALGALVAANATPVNFFVRRLPLVVDKLAVCKCLWKMVFERHRVLFDGKWQCGCYGFWKDSAQPIFGA